MSQHKSTRVIALFLLVVLVFGLYVFQNDPVLQKYRHLQLKLLGTMLSGGIILIYFIDRYDGNRKRIQMMRNDPQYPFIMWILDELRYYDRPGSLSVILTKIENRQGARWECIEATHEWIVRNPEDAKILREKYSTWENQIL